MSAWAEDDLSRIGAATEVQVSSTRQDGSLRPYVTIWGVRAGDEIYVRSAYGPENGWFRRAKASGTGRIRAAGVERDVTFAEPDPGVHEEIDAPITASTTAGLIESLTSSGPTGDRPPARPGRPRLDRGPDTQLVPDWTASVGRPSCEAAQEASSLSASVVGVPAAAV
jgi:hypothetical protein